MSEHDYHYTPADFLGWALESGWKPDPLPIGVVFTFQVSVPRFLEEHELFAANGDLTVANGRSFMTSDEGPPVLVSCLNPGGASMATQLEHLRFLGDTFRFAAIVGTAGGLVPGYAIGDVAVVRSAIRDDLLSDRYLPQARIAEGDDSLAESLGDVLNGASSNARTWSVAVPYRQTRAELEAAKADGAEVVEMEIATLFAVAEVLDLRATAAVVISDVSRVEGWEVDWSDTTAPLNNALQATVAAMRKQAEGR